MENLSGQICDSVAVSGPKPPQTDPLDPRQAWARKHRIDRILTRYDHIPWTLWGSKPITREEVGEMLDAGAYDQTPEYDRDTIKLPASYPRDFYPELFDDDPIIEELDDLDVLFEDEEALQ